MNRWESRFRRNPHVTWSELEDECVLLNLSNGIYYTLNSVGRFVWESLDGSRSLAEVHRELVLQYDVDADRAEKDILELVDEFVREGLLESDAQG